MLANTLIFVLSFVLVLSVVVFIHEYGHYGVAKLFGTKVDRFSVGFGKPFARWVSRSGEEWVVGRLPLGGYVKFAGDMNAASMPSRSPVPEGVDPASLFQNKPLWQRALIVAAGPVANFALAALIFAGLAMGRGITDPVPVVQEVRADSPAEEAGFQAGDRVVALDGRDMDTASEVRTYLSLRSGETIVARVERDGAPVDLTVVPERVEDRDMVGGRAQVGRIGVMIGAGQAVEPHHPGPLEALGHGVSQVGVGIAATGTYIGRIFTGKEDGTSLGGVLRIAAITGKAGVDAAEREVPMAERAEGFALTLVSLAAMLSIGLGIANLLPIPMLDGGHLLFYGYEAIAGRPLSEAAQDTGYRLGLLTLGCLFLILTFNDVGYIRSLLS